MWFKVTFFYLILIICFQAVASLQIAPSIKKKLLEIIYFQVTNHHHHDALSAWIFLTLSRYPSLSDIAFGRSSGLHPVSALSCCMYVCPSLTSSLCSSLRKGPREYITYEFVPTSPAVSCMSGSSNFDSFRDGWLVTVQLLFCGVLSPGLVPYCSQHYRVVAVKLLLHTFC